jgi:hypothetical protein
MVELRSDVILYLLGAVLVVNVCGCVLNILECGVLVAEELAEVHLESSVLMPQIG